MAMQLRYRERHARIVEDLLHYGKIGDCKVLYGTYENHTSSHGFMFVKSTKGLVKIYSIYRGYIHNDSFDNSIAEFRKSSKDNGGGVIKWMPAFTYTHRLPRNRHNGGTDYTFRAFISLGIVMHMGIKWMRGAEIWEFQDTEIASIREKGFSFGLNGKLISRVPKQCKNLFEAAKEDQRQAKNRNARANYANTSTVAKVRNARATGDYSKLVPQDIFKLRNVALRTELLDHYGQDKVLDSIDHDVIHKDEIDGRKYELLRFSLPFQRFGQDDPALATYLKMINPSTGETCIEGVPNNVQGSPWSTAIDMNCVKDALKWRDGDVKSYDVPQVLT